MDENEMSSLAEFRRLPGLASSYEGFWLQTLAEPMYLWKPGSRRAIRGESRFHADDNSYLKRFHQLIPIFR